MKHPQKRFNAVWSEQFLFPVNPKIVEVEDPRQPSPVSAFTLPDTQLSLHWGVKGDKSYHIYFSWPFPDLKDLTLSRFERHDLSRLREWWQEWEVAMAEAQAVSQLPEKIFFRQKMQNWIFYHKITDQISQNCTDLKKSQDCNMYGHCCHCQLSKLWQSSQMSATINYDRVYNF